MRRFLRNVVGYVVFEMTEITASILGIVAIVCFVTVACLTFAFLADRVPTVVNLSLSFVSALIASIVPGYLAVRLGRLSE